jgi:hypothetical protein
MRKERSGVRLPLAAVIRELRLEELERKHRSLPRIVLETELKRRPVYVSYSYGAEQELTRVFRGGPFLKGDIVDEDFVIENLPSITFDSSTLGKIEEAVCRRFGIDGICDVPQVPYYKGGRAVRLSGIELIRNGRVVSTLLENVVFIDRSCEFSEELADVLVAEIYRAKSKPGFLTLLFSRLMEFVRSMVKR